MGRRIYNIVLLLSDIFVLIDVVKSHRVPFDWMFAGVCGVRIRKVGGRSPVNGVRLIRCPLPLDSKLDTLFWCRVRKDV